jgi:hypothetical protein
MALAQITENEAEYHQNALGSPEQGNDLLFNFWNNAAVLARKRNSRARVWKTVGLIDEWSTGRRAKSL